MKQTAIINKVLRLVKTLPAALLAAAALLTACQDRIAGGWDTYNTTAEASNSGLYFYMYVPLISEGDNVPSGTTRANPTSEYGDNTYSENKIDNIDIFFYNKGATNETLPRFHLQGGHFEKVDSNTHYQAVIDGKTVGHTADTIHTGCLYKVFIRATETDREQIFGEGYGDEVECFIVANRPWSGYPDDEYSLGAVRSAAINTNWPTVNFSAYTFPMSGSTTLKANTVKTTKKINAGTQYEETMEIDSITGVTGIVPLRRSAAKIQAYINVADSAIITDYGDSTKQVWFPMKNYVTISFYNGATRGMIDSIPEDLGEKSTDFYEVLTRETYRQTVTHEEDAYDKDSNLIKRDSVFEYYYTHKPFYSYPRKWDSEVDLTGTEEDDAAKFVVCVPWRLKTAGTSGSSESDYGEQVNTYYQFSANRISNEFVKNTFYKLYTKITKPGSTVLSVPVEITPLGYTIQPWGDVTMGNGIGDNINGEFVSYDYLVVDPITKIVKNAASTTFNYASSSAIEVKVVYAKYIDYSSAGKTDSLVWESPDDDSNIEKHYKYRIDDENKTITITHDFSGDDYEKSKTVLHEIHVQVTNKSGLTETIYIYQYPEIYIETIPGDNVFLDGYFGHVLNNGARGSYNRVAKDGSYYEVTQEQRVIGGTNYYVPYGSTALSLTQTGGTDGQLSNDRLVLVNVTAFNSENGYYTKDNTNYYYIIGDPRVNAGYTSDDLIDYYGNVDSTYTYEERTWWGGTQTRTATTSTYEWKDEAAAAIMNGTETDEGKRLIAPSFLLSSAWASSGVHSFTVAQKRAATYQEAGFPAGRWRLPTEAEMQFCQYLNDKGIIPAEFGKEEGTYYWASSGRAFEAKSKTFKSNVSSAYSRQVYDVWYWGTDSWDETQYHIIPIKGGSDYAKQRTN